MRYHSTRDSRRFVSAAEAIKTGISPDGGLFVPAAPPAPLSPEELGRLAGEPYHRRAAAVLNRYLHGFEPARVEHWLQAAYSAPRFDHPAVAPLQKVQPGIFLLELWHGPTCAFKDMALQVMPYLLQAAVAMTEEEAEVVILVATSGDTGKAALEGFRDVPGTRIIVFYPENGVSEVQQRQMVTQEGNNVTVAAVRGNFDDTQNGVKAVFTDPSVREILARRGFRLSSANSINWGRLAPQIAYYFSAYLDLLQQKEVAMGEAVNFVVPTGNFGNILSAFYARSLGLPVNRLICAANSNNVLADFIRTGVYNRKRAFFKTLSPSMDILIASNLERLLFELAAHDAARVREWMASLARYGEYTVGADIAAAITGLFWSDYADDGETLDTIRRVYGEHAYLLDTHTAVGWAVYEKYRAATGDDTPTVIVSTASPFKFNASVCRALLDPAQIAHRSEFELLELLSAHTERPIPPPLRELDRRPVKHTAVVEKDKMREYVLSSL